MLDVRGLGRLNSEKFLIFTDVRAPMILQRGDRFPLDRSPIGAQASEDYWGYRPSPMSILGQKQTSLNERERAPVPVELVSAMAPAFNGLIRSGKVRVWIAKAPIACQHIRATLFN